MANDPNTPDKDEGTEEQASLNADDLDVQELDEKLLDSVAGGMADALIADGCSGYSVSNTIC